MMFASRKRERNRGEKRVNEIHSKLSLLASVDDIINGYWFQGETRLGRYFEVTGRPPSNVEISIYKNKKSSRPFYYMEFKVSKDSSGMRRIAEMLYEAIEKDIGDKIESITLMG